MTESLLIARDKIRRDGGTQPRAGLNEPTVTEYAEAKARGVKFPALQVVFDGTDYWLWDGFHRDAADGRLGLIDVACDVRAGTRRDAVLLAAGANATHGLRRTNEDKRRAVLILLDDPEWSQWSDREIAKRAHVSHPLVAEMRALTGNSTSERTYETKHGTVATMDTAAIGKRAADLATARTLDPVVLYRLEGERRALRQTLKKEKRAANEVALAEKIEAGNAALSGLAASAKRYGVILADPEWRFEVYSRESGMDRAADNHYPTSSTDEICKRPVADIAADDCVLLLWATAPMLPDALRVMAAWGFAYKSQVVWLKDAVGTGYWFRNQHELLLLGTRGNVPAPAMGTQFRSALAHTVGDHSEKPPFAHEIAEAYFPNLPKIELNARAARPGWDVWGAEAPEAERGAPMAQPTPAELDALAAELGAACVASVKAGRRPEFATELAALRRKRGAAETFPSCSGLSRASTSSADESGSQDVDARHKGEHDAVEAQPAVPKAKAKPAKKAAAKPAAKPARKRRAA